MQDIDIARGCTLQPISELASNRLKIPSDSVELYGPLKAKLSLDYLGQIQDRPDGKLILVTSITPTPAGEGKTTTSIGLCDGLNRIGKDTAVCLREPSLGPCFGMKGGGTGGGYAQIAPMADINLHFNGDFHAISAAHNLLAAILDNHVHYANTLGLDVRRIGWKRVLDVNDRALRNIAIGLGGPLSGYPRESGFDITSASEIMAILCLSKSLPELRQRLGNIVTGYTRRMEPVTARDLGAHGAMTALLRDAINPNLVQTLEGNPALVHGGPFANIAHGCNSVMATSAALKLADYVVTEAGFGADLGAEKFVNIKCRKSGLRPDVAVVVATIRALKYQGGSELAELSRENLPALQEGCANLERHVRNVREAYGLPCVVAINRFSSDSQKELELLRGRMRELDLPVSLANHWAEGGKGAEDLAHQVIETIDTQEASLRFVYDDDLHLFEKVEAVARKVYGAAAVVASGKIRRQLERLENDGYRSLPICIAKTQYSFSTNPALRGVASGHEVHIREVRLAAGAEFVVIVCGNMQTMPGLPTRPAAESIDVNRAGHITGLF